MQETELIRKQRVEVLRLRGMAAYNKSRGRSLHGRSKGAQLVADNHARYPLARRSYNILVTRGYLGCSHTVLSGEGAEHDQTCAERPAAEGPHRGRGGKSVLGEGQLLGVMTAACDMGENSVHSCC